MTAQRRDSARRSSQRSRKADQPFSHLGSKTTEDFPRLAQLDSLTSRIELHTTVEKNTNTFPLWNFAASRVAGAGHLNRNSQVACQDFCAYSTSPPCVVVADGAGSAVNSDIGSELVTRTFLALTKTYYFATQLLAAHSSEASLQQLANSIYSSLVASLISHAEIQRLPTDSLASTIAAAVISSNGMVFWFAVGDSMVVIRDGNEFYCNSENKTGAENETSFVGSASPDYCMRYGLYKPTRSLRGVACLSDGAHFGLISAKTGSPGKAFQLLFEKIESNQLTSSYLQDFLSTQDLWTEKHRDDRSLAIAAPCLTQQE